MTESDAEEGEGLAVSLLLAGCLRRSRGFPRREAVMRRGMVATRPLPWMYYSCGYVFPSELACEIDQTVFPWGCVAVDGSLTVAMPCERGSRALATIINGLSRDVDGVFTLFAINSSSCDHGIFVINPLASEICTVIRARK